MEVHPSALKHGVEREDIEHALRNAMVIEDQDDDTGLYLGAGQNGQLLEVVTLVRDDASELVIHALPMRAKYRRLLLVLAATLTLGWMSPSEKFAEAVAMTD